MDCRWNRHWTGCPDYGLFKDMGRCVLVSTEHAGHSAVESVAAKSKSLWRSWVPSTDIVLQMKPVVVAGGTTCSRNIDVP
eukprot:15414969-Alexandrium_andersonii.AAC.1